MCRPRNNLWALLANDDGTPRQDSRSLQASPSLHSSESGFLSFITCVAVLFMALLVTLVFNVGGAVKQKVDLQNAADASILTSSSMTARGMNAITLTNHMLGELTALMVLHEALGGTELDDNVANGDERKSSPPSTLLNTSLTTLLPLSSSYELHALDEQTVNRMKKDGGSDDDSGGKHLAFGTIFDARLTLKYYMTEVLIGRLVAFAVRFIPFGIGEVLYWAINIPLSVLVGKMFQEVLIIDGIEEIAKLFSKVAKRRVVESQMLPFLENYAEVCTKQFPVIATRVAEETAKRNGVELVLYPARVELPVEREPAPQGQGLGTGREPRAGNAESPADGVLKAFDVLGSATSFLDDANDTLGTNGSVQNPGASLRPNPGKDGYGPGANLSRDSLPKLSTQEWKKIEQSQWTRATYPYVRGWRKPIREWFAGVLMVSRAGTWYSRWTNRYTVAKAYQYRIGTYGGQKNQRKLAMFVMQGAPKSGKGKEPWTTDGKKAEPLFTQLAFVHRDARQPLATAIFGSAPKDGMVAYSQAIFYNGNRQNIAGWRDGSTFQPELGWDTLNWRAPIASARAYEFLEGDDADMRIIPPAIPFIMFTKASEHPDVRLNWQAKLTPVTRYSEAWRAGLRMPDGMRNTLLKLPLDLDTFRTH
ncbi:MAG: hypothetical protein C0483_10000 [Pirellula sp.]|nr:hypothetical protein [Pirellula sp.]